jgi:polyphosphate glucokinase
MLNYDHLFLGGGNAKKITFKLPPKTSIVSNVAGLKGGAALWRHGRRPVAMHKA